MTGIESAECRGRGMERRVERKGLGVVEIIYMLNLTLGAITLDHVGNNNAAIPNVYVEGSGTTGIALIRVCLNFFLSI